MIGLTTKNGIIPESTTHTDNTSHDKETHYRHYEVWVGWRLCMASSSSSESRVVGTTVYHKYLGKVPQCNGKHTASLIKG
jgi:hypothetical protein